MTSFDKQVFESFKSWLSSNRETVKLSLFCFKHKPGLSYSSLPKACRAYMFTRLWKSLYDRIPIEKKLSVPLAFLVSKAFKEEGIKI